MKRPTMLLTPILLSVCLGCTSSTSGPTTANDDKESATPAAAAETTISHEAETPEATITLEIKSWEETQKSLAQYEGKVVIVDLWSSWCVPCMREFPNLVNLQQTFDDQVQCVSVNLNYNGVEAEPPESHRDKVLEFLTKRQAVFANILCSDPDEKVMSEIDLASIPAVLVYDQQGQLHKRFDNDEGLYGDEGFTYADHIVPVVKQLLDGEPLGNADAAAEE